MYRSTSPRRVSSLTTVSSRYNNRRSPNLRRGGSVIPTDDYFRETNADGSFGEPKVDGRRVAPNVQLVAVPPVPVMQQELEEIQALYRRYGVEYNTAVSDLNRLVMTERSLSRVTPDGGEKIRAKIATQKTNVGELANDLFLTITRLVTHVAMMKLSDAGLYTAQARLRWGRISFDPIYAHGIDGIDGQNINTEIGELHTANVDVKALFRTYMRAYPTLQAHLEEHANNA